MVRSLTLDKKLRDEDEIANEVSACAASAAPAAPAATAVCAHAPLPLVTRALAPQTPCRLLFPHHLRPARPPRVRPQRVRCSAPARACCSALACLPVDCITTMTCAGAGVVGCSRRDHFPAQRREGTSMSKGGKDDFTNSAKNKEDLSSY